ncbi:hypothetical protein NAL32_19900 [Chryseobacterium sp. Ch-15]|uniref:Lipoprotein n=1 Tax=Chryseobacterium muglaense TaxID=2893752 RepID=A0A9Q3UUI6_9FLAO|nr:hypothetical protein [Chryseobacterium muglaense]MBD3906934.1 hypothetical protein [Chryseobacterium muglaense]MCC9033736.1 hypothetical protein [Chryseobacterium muglaense]MCM2556660.1 hypothetical protein [Chryseobacterium muglaense]
MFKQILIIVIIFFSLISCLENFEKLPEKYRSDENLLKQIKPNSKIEYWQIDYVTGFSPDKIFSNGNLNLIKEIQFPKNHNLGGFFTECQPLHCNYRILYIENNKWNFVQDKDELKKFIGKIDNEYEAFLIARINNYNIDSKSNGNGFEKTDYGYKLKVMVYNSCPETKQSFIVTVDKKGKLNKLTDLGYYLQSGDCIIY